MKDDLVPLLGDGPAVGAPQYTIDIPAGAAQGQQDAPKQIDHAPTVGESPAARYRDLAIEDLVEEERRVLSQRIGREA